MTSQKASKFAAFALALTFNGMMLGGIAYLFNGQLQHSPLTSLMHYTSHLLAEARF